MLYKLGCLSYFSTNSRGEDYLQNVTFNLQLLREEIKTVKLCSLVAATYFKRLKFLGQSGLVQTYEKITTEWTTPV